MTRFQRFWEIEQNVSLPMPTTTGIAEGDPVAVLIMVLIGATWIFQVAPDPLITRMSAYADNWSWGSTDPASHEPIALATSEVCQVAGLQVDMTKTWKWSTDPAMDQAVHQASKQLSPQGIACQTLAHAKDLGLEMRYAGPPALTTIQDRFTEGSTRLARVQASKWPLDIRRHLVKASVFPAAFHGAEVVIVPDTMITRFRRSVVEALLQTTARTMSPVLITMLVDKGDLDPALAIILQCVRKARNWLLIATPQERSDFCGLASRHRGNPKTTRGPASVLGYHLEQIGLTITAQGHIQVGLKHTLCLWHTSWQEVRFWLRHAWLDRRIEQSTNRFHLYNMMPCDTAATLQVLQKFSVDNQCLILREIAQAFQTGYQKQKWDPECDGACQFCGQPDTIWHRFLECITMQEIRDKHPSILRILEEEQAGWVEWPVLQTHPLYEYLLNVKYAIPEMPLPELVVQQASSFPQAPRFYTDGGCKGPSNPSARYASYAIVMDLHHDSDLRRAEADRYLATGQLPEGLQVVGKGLLPGLQDIHRAELLALALLAEALPAFDAWTDSQVARSAFATAQQARSEADFADSPHFDLIRRIYHCRTPHQRIHKIAAHQKATPDMPLDDVYHICGNALADATATAVLEDDTHPLIRDLQEQLTSQRRQQDLLGQFLRYLLELQQTRARVDHQPWAVADSWTASAGIPVSDLFANWFPDEVWIMPTRLQSQGLWQCAWGRQSAAAMRQFLRTCRWPTTELGPGGRAYGFSWIELALAVMRHMKAYLPVRRVNDKNQQILVYLTSFQHAKREGVTLTELGETAYYLLQQLQDMIPERVLPEVPKGRNRSLYAMGETRKCNGLLLRPSFEGQAMVVDQVRHYLQHHRQLPELPEVVPQWPSDVANSHLTWMQRTARTRPILHAVKAIRKAKPT